MNLRTVVAALYLTVFAVTLLNMMALPNSVIAENVRARIDTCNICPFECVSLGGHVVYRAC